MSGYMERLMGWLLSPLGFVLVIDFGVMGMTLFSALFVDDYAIPGLFTIAVMFIFASLLLVFALMLFRPQFFPVGVPMGVGKGKNTPAQE